MKKFCVISVVLGLVSSNLFAYPLTGVTDSLKKLIEPSLKRSAQSPDTMLIRRIDQLAEEFYESSPDSTTYYGNLEISLAKKIKDQRGIADGQVQIANVNKFRGEYKTSEGNYNAALSIYKKIGYSHGIVKSLIGLGRLQEFSGSFAAAIKSYNLALSISRNTKNLADEADCYNMLGITYDNKGQFSKALDNYFKSLSINIQQKDELSAADKYCNIGIIMQELELYPKALAYYSKALTIWQRFEDTQGIATINQNIGEVLLEQKKYDNAIKHLQKASATFHSMSDQEGISLIYYDLGLYHYNNNHIDSALYYMDLSLQSADKNKISFNRVNAFEGLAKAYNKAKDFKNAFKYASVALSTADKLGSKNLEANATLQVSIALAGLKRFEEAYLQLQRHALLRSELKHSESVQKAELYNLEIEFARKQKQIAEKAHKREEDYKSKIAMQKNVNFFYVLAIAVTAPLSVVYYRGRRRQKQINAELQEKNREILSQKEHLNSQSIKLNELNLLKDRLIGILAHDLRAPISTLRGLFTLMIDETIGHEEFIEMTPKVFSRLEHTSDFLDTLLFWINSQVDTASKEVTRFEMNDLVERELTHIEDRLEQKDITVQVDIPPDTIVLADPSSIRIVIHNLLTNAIKFSNRGSSIRILARLEDGMVVFCIKDNGIGMSEDYRKNLFKSRINSIIGTENESGTGMGLLFCKDLIEKYNGRIWVESTPGEGTAISFALPIGTSI